MKFNIYGVGRSGTKAVQLYLSYMLAKRNGYVKINYEPFYWRNRFLDISYRGIECNRQLPLFMEKCFKTTLRCRKYLENLNITENSITKFIRGNGRIEFLNSITNPDYTIIVIRDLFQTLSSIEQRNWSFLGKGLLYDDTERFIVEVRDRELVDRDILNSIDNNTDLNAVYWYAMNKYILDNIPHNAILLNFDNLSSIESIVSRILNIKESPETSIKLFEGESLHTDCPLQGYRKKSGRMLEKINREIIKKIDYSFQSSHSGDYACINKRKSYDMSHRKKVKRLL